MENYQCEKKSLHEAKPRAKISLKVENCPRKHTTRKSHDWNKCFSNQWRVGEKQLKKYVKAKLDTVQNLCMHFDQFNHSILT